MRPFDFAPLYRSTVGFDRLFQLLDSTGGVESEASTYPPYNIERKTENEYRISMAVAGFSRDEIDIQLKEQSLTIKGEKKADDKDRHFLHRGIATRAFERRFQLADHVEVTGADLQDGLLHVDLVRNVPERLKPRSVQIGSGACEADRGARLSANASNHSALKYLHTLSPSRRGEGDVLSTCIITNNFMATAP